MTRKDGLTLVEVLISLAILGAVAAILATSLASSVRHNAVSSQRSQAVQILNYLGRRVAGGDRIVLPPSGESLVWNYSELSTTFTDLVLDADFVGTAGDGQASPNLYSATVTSAGPVTLAGTSLVQYDVEVCYLRSEGEHCVQGTTVGPNAIPVGSPPTLPNFY